MQIRLWRQGKKTVAVFDGESRVSRQKRINQDGLLLDFEPSATKANLKTDANRNGHPRLRLQTQGCYH